MRFVVYALLLSACIITCFTGCSQPTSPLVIYSARKSHLIQPLIDKFSAETGIPVQLITDKAGVLTQRLLVEKDRTTADILMTVDVGQLWNAQQHGLFQPIQSTTLSKNVPASYRDPNGHWYGLSLRARTIVYHTDRVDPKILSTYEALATPQFAGKLVLRTSKKVYNQSLVAMLIHHVGNNAMADIVSGWVQNLAIPVRSSDTDVLKQILAGQGDIGIVNTYYLARLLAEDSSLPLTVFWPNQETTGTHVNISGAGVLTHSDQPAIAQQFLEWLSLPDNQHHFAELNYEYPVHPDVSAHPLVANWGSFKADSSGIHLAGEGQIQAIQLMTSVSYR